LCCILILAKAEGGKKNSSINWLAIHVKLGLVIAAAHLWCSGLQQQKQERQWHQYSCLDPNSYSDAATRKLNT